MHLIRANLRDRSLPRAGLLLLWALPAALFAEDRFEQDPINYSTAAANNPVSRLQDALGNKSVTLDFDPKFGYLKSLLDALNIPVDSQVLVFSKTSFQHRYISPSTPRAIYFNDNVYVGTVQHGEVLEVSTADPNLGAVFYALPQQKGEQPQFARQSFDCLQCHGSTLTNGVPGHLVRSVFPDADGYPMLKAGSFVTTQDSPFEERWGGWYVTGTHGNLRHLGNGFAVETERGITINMEAKANVTRLDLAVDAEAYLTPHSDLVALMVLEHQTKMHNLLSIASFETRLALRDQEISNAIFENPPETRSDSTLRRIASVGDKLVDYMLFVNEIELKEKIDGTSGFVESFAKRGPHDSRGRSLRELDLEERLFVYPLSYLIYSEQFDGLPQESKDYVYRKLWDILNGTIATPEYLHLTNAKCRAIREILHETKPGLPNYWTP